MGQLTRRLIGSYAVIAPGVVIVTGVDCIPATPTTWWVVIAFFKLLTVIVADSVDSNRLEILCCQTGLSFTFPVTMQIDLPRSR